MTKTYTYSDELYSDLHKDALGFRPRGEALRDFWVNASPDEKQAHWDGLIATLERNERDQAEAQQEAVAAFDAKPLEERQAILIKEMDGTGDPDYACYHLGLPYGHLTALAKSINQEMINHG